MDPKVTIDLIEESGDELYQKLANMVLTEKKKLVLCVEQENQMNNVVAMLKRKGLNPNRIVKFDPENTSKASREEWKIVDQLMKEPHLKDVVITWEAGNRCHNYFPECYPIALFHF